jgi:hypothetical protein
MRVHAPVVILALRLPQEMHDALREIATENCRSLAAEGKYVLQQYIAAHEKAAA